MEIRPLKPEELEQFIVIDSEAFQQDRASTERWATNEVKPYLHNTRVLVEDDEIKSVLFMLIARLWLGNGTVPMPGILSVATPPEYRRQGYLNRLLTGLMHELRESGYGIATLYPFFFPFYKKYGFEQVSASKNVTVAVEQLQKFRPKTPGQWKKATPEQWAEFNSIWEVFCQGKFGAFSRDQDFWQMRRLGKYNPKPLTNYLWYDAAGQAQAFLIYSVEGDEANRTLRCNRAWTSPAAYHEILAFLANHDSQIKKVGWYTGLDEEVYALLDNPREAEEKTTPGYMLRILDAPRALTQRPWPSQESGSFTIELKDDRLEWNNLALQIEVSGGKAEVQTIPVHRTNLSCDIRQLSQLYAGYLSPVALAKLGLLEVRNQADLQTAQRLFSPAYQAASHMPDFF